MAKIGFIGMGNMGTAIMRGLLKTYKPEELLFTSAHEAKMQKITEETGVAHVSTATDCAEQVKYLVLAVKPQVLPTVFKELNGKIRKDQVVISIAAGMRSRISRQVSETVRESSAPCRIHRLWSARECPG